jgi:hypothetical protein
MIVPSATLAFTTPFTVTVAFPPRGARLPSWQVGVSAPTLQAPCVAVIDVSVISLGIASLT